MVHRSQKFEPFEWGALSMFYGEISKIIQNTVDSRYLE